jgi:hypothetical protein
MIRSPVVSVERCRIDDPHQSPIRIKAVGRFEDRVLAPDAPGVPETNRSYERVSNGRITELVAHRRVAGSNPLWLTRSLRNHSANLSSSDKPHVESKSNDGATIAVDLNGG